jgi:hypothetical protein
VTVGAGIALALAAGAMKNPSLLHLSFVALSLLAGCASSSSSSNGPVIDNLDVTTTTTALTIQGQTGPGRVMTLTAHDDGAGINALHCVFPELNADKVIQIPNAPTTVNGQKIELVILNAPKGAHNVEFHLTDAQGRSSSIVDKTITVP